MRITIFLLSLLLLFNPVMAEEIQEEADPEADIASKRKAAVDAFFKDNPEIAKRFKSKTKKTETVDSGQATETPAPVKKPATPTIKQEKFNGSRETADDAFAKGDYETALKHYKALAEEGDGEASLTAGIMYGEGLGVEKDNAEAYAWLKRASDQGEKTATSLISSSRQSFINFQTGKDDDLSENEYERAQGRIKEFSGETDKKGVVESTLAPATGLALQSYTQINRPPTKGPLSSSEPAFDDTSEWLWRPEKTVTLIRLKKSGAGTYSWFPPKLAENGHYAPDKYIRDLQ